MKINIFGANALIQVEKPADKTAGGLIIPEDQRERNMFGRVVIMGERKRKINVGDLVMFNAYQEVDNKLLESQDPNFEYVLVKQEDIYAGIEEDEVAPPKPNVSIN